MKDTALYQAILGLLPPWAVDSVQVDKTTQRVTVTIVYESHLAIACPTCSKAVRKHDSRKRIWRHLDTCQFETYLEAEVPRADCPKHGIQTIPVPWASPGSRYSELFETKIIETLQFTSLHSVAKAFRLSWGAIDRIMKRAVLRGLARRSLNKVEDLLVDETAFCRGHDYVTVMSSRTGQVLAVADGKSEQSLATCYEVLPNIAKQQIRSVSMDMSQAFINATESFFGSRSKRLIAVDHFHVAKVLTKAVDDVRKQEANSLPTFLKRECHRTRYGWLKRNGNLAGRLRERINMLAKLMLNTGLSWALKEQARLIWYGSSIRRAKDQWLEWLALVKASGIKPLITAATTVKKHLPAILNAMRLKASNGLAEAINAKIQYMKLRAKGFRNKERFKTAILFYFGRLDMAFHHER
ncbi:ISL3 family transposase [Photobacterium sp. TY1-4]|uniref:ISL3 family transposase n=1 Tax=Photobacterium sp. TY1-4 TaxID=2899122 RepID=UPI0021C127DA|nr:ISL3 family transposase [Photobacterium sp. TY1-4]UXH99933.1 ISL3 family transposase [Photobacterium sp. TY1-4]